MSQLARDVQLFSGVLYDLVIGVGGPQFRVQYGAEVFLVTDGLDVGVVDGQSQMYDIVSGVQEGECLGLTGVDEQVVILPPFCCC